MGLFDFFKRKNNDEELDALKKENEALKYDVSKLQHNIEILLEKILSDKDWSEDTKENFEEVFALKEVSKEKNKSKPIRKKNQQPITKYTRFEQYKVPMDYSIEGDFFYVSHKSGKISHNHSDLTFAELVEIAKAVQKKIPLSQLVNENKVLNHYTKGMITQWSYKYRAEAYNDAIRKYAAELGYNADKLVYDSTIELEEYND